MKTHSRNALVALVGVAMLGFGVSAHADDKKEDDGKKNRRIVVKADGDEDAGEKDEPEFPPFDKQVKDYQKIEGFWDLYYKAKDQSLLGVVPSGELERPFLLTSSLSGGTNYAGWQWTDTLVAWERLGKKLMLVEKNTHYRADPEKPIAEAVVRTYTDRVILSTHIISEGPKGYLIDLREVLLDRSRSLLQMFSVDSSLAKVSKAKSFPGNIEIAFAAPLSGDGTIITFHYSIARLPDPERFRARLADDRIGYFLTAIKDFTKGDPAEQRFLRFINKWDLRKASPELAISPPVKPIVFYIEKTVPFRYRRWVEAGILEWNKAFEKIGFSGAMVVRQQTADNEFKDFDPEDARYNFFRWIVTDEGYAMGPSRVDPRTGQILDADIIFDDSMVEFYAGEYETLLKEGPGLFRPKNGRETTDAKAAIDKLSLALEPLGVKLDPEKVAAVVANLSGKNVPGQPARTKAELDALVRSSRKDACKIGEGIRHELAFAAAARLAAFGGDEDPTRAKLVPEDFVGEVVKEIVMHEVGHTLGLRHNFKGSSYRSLTDINSDEKPLDISGSIMDYNAINIAPEGCPQGHWQNTVLGPYDVWAIEYGYKPGDDGRDLEPPALAAIAARSNEPGHAYGTDEDVGSDPQITRWDMGNDPIAYAKSRIALTQKLRAKLLARAVKTGESWEKLRRAFDMVLFEQARAGMYASLLVGAQDVRRNHKGDPGERPPLSPVPAAVQREALRFACEQVFDDASYKLTPELLTHLAAPRWSHWGSNDDSSSIEYPIHERILAVQRYTLNTLLDDDVFQRLRNAQLKAQPGEDVLTLTEFFATIEGVIFKELDGKAAGSNGNNAKAPFISTFRQNLQDFYIRRLTDFAISQQTPGVIVPNLSAKKIAQQRLRILQEKAAGAVTGVAGLDDDSKAHLEALAARSQQVRSAEYVHIASGCALSEVPGAPAAMAPLAIALVLILVRRFRRG